MTMHVMSCISIQCLRRDIEQAGRHTCHCMQQARQPVAKKNSMLIVLELASTRCYLTVDWGTPFPVPLLRSTLLLPLLLLPDFLSLSVILPAEKVLLPGRRRLPEANFCREVTGTGRLGDGTKKSGDGQDASRTPTGRVQDAARRSRTGVRARRQGFPAK